MEWLRNNAIALVLALVSAIGFYTKIHTDSELTRHKISGIISTLDARKEYINKLDVIDARSNMNSREVDEIDASMAILEIKVDRNTIASERMAVAVENLVTVTTELNSTVSSLTVTAARLEEKTSE
ncbi:hypothetical protein VPHD148_0306 [Vibrio phage D148]